MTTFTPADLEQLKAKGISTESVEAQLERFRTGFPYLKIDSPSSLGHGITPVNKDVEEACEARWQQFLADGGDVVKFVPASGAASRMFKALFAFVNGADAVPAEGSPVAQLIDRIHDFAFFPQLQATVDRLHGKSVEELIAEGRHKDVVAAIILPEGMNYGGLPKALLTFHKYPEGATRTAMEEQLAEGAQTAASDGKVKLHFTVSADHHKLFEEKLTEAIPAMEAKFGVKYDVSMSEQKPSTDTIAVTPDNDLFRDDNGKLVFRPGGHGALIENLNDIDAEVIFIKNIDNVVADAHREPTIRYKRLIGGMLLLVHDRMEQLRAALEGTDEPKEEDVKAAAEFVSSILCTADKSISKQLSLRERADAILRIFDRPLRVCGMVRNEGEPGGGPYNAYSSDGYSIAPQILESTQIDLSKPENEAMMKKATHFNPVDLVCYVRRHDGTRYNLPDFVDHATGFISEKSFGGRELRALELPGLWNGAMSHWNTVFMEVPAATFNPVKTVNDLLRPAHK